MRWLRQRLGRRSRQQQADALMRQGLACLARGRTRQAQGIARKLYALGYSGGFEIEAQALASEGSKAEAVEVLRKGLRAAPDSWLNGNLLGNYLSDLGRYEEAFDAYEAALRADAVDRILVEANYALALSRAGREDEARRKIDAVAGRDLSEAEPGLQRLVLGLAEDIGSPD